MTALLHRTVTRLRRALGRTDHGQATDRCLLERFAATGDEEAFAALVERHGSLVLGVCRRVLGNQQDAEDAFQAVFLVLARKAGSLAWQDSVKNWLHGVAYRVALKARTQAARRKRGEQRRRDHEARSQDAHKGAASEAAWDELRGVLDDELARLPAKYRAPLLLCYLEGKTRDEAAEELGWSAGSLKGRLERGRELLRQRLLQRGLPLGAVLCASFLEGGSACAAPSALLLETTIQSGLGFVGVTSSGAALAPNILHLAQGVLHAMLIAKIKTGLLTVLCVGLLGLGGWSAGQALSARETGNQAQERVDPSAQQRDKDAKKDAPRDGDRDVKKDAPRDGDKPRDKDRPRETNELRGDLKEINLAAGIISVLVGREGNRTERVLLLAGKDVPITTTAGQPFAAADLKPGTAVLLKLDAEDDVEAIRVALPTMFGFLSAVDPVKRTISTRMEGQVMVLDVAKDAKLFLGERTPATLKEFTVGVRVSLTLSFDKQTVLTMHAAPRDGERPREEAPRLVQVGVVVGIDAAKNTVDILTGADDNMAIATYALAKDAALQVRTGRTPQKLTLAQLPKATRVTFSLSEDKKAIATLDAPAPMLRVQITGVDAAGKKIGYRVDRTDAKRLPVADEATIIVPGKRGANLGDLRENMRAVLFLSLDRSQIVGVQVVIPDGERRPEGRPEERNKVEPRPDGRED